MDEKQNYKNLEYYFYLGSLIQLGCVLIAMMLTSRMIEVTIPFLDYHLNTTGGMLLIPVAFIIQDIITEIYGYTLARNALMTTLIIYVSFVFLMYLIALIPCEIGDSACNATQKITESMPRHAMSFVFSLFVGATANNLILSKMKLFFNGRFLAFRFISATAIGELCFQIIAVAISWSGTYSVRDMLPMAFISYGYKIILGIFATPMNVYVCRYLKYIQQNETISVTS